MCIRNVVPSTIDKVIVWKFQTETNIQPTCNTTNQRNGCLGCLGVVDAYGCLGRLRMHWMPKDASDVLCM